MKISRINNNYIVIDKVTLSYLHDIGYEYDDKRLLYIVNRIYDIILKYKELKMIDVKEFMMIINDSICEYLVEIYRISNRYDTNDFLSIIEEEQLINSLHFSIVSGDEDKIKKIIPIVQKRDILNLDKFRNKYGEELTNYILEHSYYDYYLEENNYPSGRETFLLENWELKKYRVSENGRTLELILDNK